MALSSIKSLLTRALTQHGIAGGVEAAQAIAAMEEEIEKRWGEDGRRGITVKYFKNGAIAVSCTSSVWAQEIQLKGKEILEAVRENLGNKVEIEIVRFVA